MGATALNPSLRQSIAGRGADLSVAGQSSARIFRPARRRKWNSE